MCRLFLVTCACLAILFGSFGFYMMPRLVQQKIEQRMQLKIGTKTFERFTRVPIAITVKFWLFNITNSEAVLAGLERPQFAEVGPFLFRQWRRRDIIDIVDNNRKITYREYKTFYSAWPADAAANESASWRLDDGTLILNPRAHRVTIVNVPLLAVLNQLGQLEEGSLKRGVAARVLSRLIREADERILISKPVNELLFDGYKVGLMEAASELISSTLGFNFESPLPRNKFGFFHGKNGTWSRREAGEMTIFTGRNESMNDFMLVDNWNNKRSLDVWPKNTEAGNRCNEIRGTDGSQFHPGVTRDQTLDIFSPLICGSIFIKYKEDTACRGIPLLRFTTPPEVFAAPKKNPRNACFCTITQQTNQSGQTRHARQPHSAAANSSHQPAGPRHKARITDSRCYIDGLMDLSLCQKGAPIVASGAHFYNADPMLAMAADLKPQKHLHETHLDIEPMTGAVMRAASRAQINAMVEQAALDVIEPQLVGNMTAMVAPLLWLEESAEIDEKSSQEFKSQLLDNLSKARRTFFYATAFGCILLLVTGFQYWYTTCYGIDTSAKRRRRNDKLAKISKRADARLDAMDPANGRRNPGPKRPENFKPPTLTGLESGDKRIPVTGSLVAAAAVMGAADAAVTVNQRRRDRERRRTRRADYEEDNEDELSKRGLVDNEWAPVNRSTTSAENSSPVASTSSADQADSPMPPQNDLDPDL